MLLKNSLELKDLTKKSKPLLKKYDILEDIIFFGSFVKEKTRPKDIDIALLVSKKDERKINKIIKDIQKIIKNIKIDFVSLSIKDVYSSVWLSVIKEGYSVSKENFFHKIYGVQPSILYKYNLTSLTNVKKVQFDRGLNKILKHLEGVRLTRTIVIIPLQRSESFEEFLKTWEIEYETSRYELLPELVKPTKALPWYISMFAFDLKDLERLK